MIVLENRVERLSKETIDDIVALSSYIGWDYNKEEIETIFNSGIVYGVWNERKELIASAAIILYGETLASIGMVNTPPIMIKNRDQLLKRNNKLYGIAAQIFG